MDHKDRALLNETLTRLPSEAIFDVMEHLAGSTVLYITKTFPIVEAKGTALLNRRLSLRKPLGLEQLLILYANLRAPGSVPDPKHVTANAVSFKGFQCKSTRKGCKELLDSFGIESSPSRVVRELERCNPTRIVRSYEHIEEWVRVL